MLGIQKCDKTTHQPSHHISPKGKKEERGGLIEAEKLLTPAVRGGVDLERFERWLSALCTEHKDRVLRCKAVVHAKGKDEKYMVQGVRGLLSIEPRQKWGE